MAFQFQCPQGHLLEGDESQAGQQCVCPVCQMLFLIPAPLVEPAGVGDASATGPGGSAGPESPGIVIHTDPASRPAVTTEPPEPELLHIPCPKGHELEVPRDMLGQDVLCPHCESQFRLRERDSIEFKHRQEAEQLRRDARAGQAWLKWVIIFAVLAVMALILLIASGR